MAKKLVQEYRNVLILLGIGAILSLAIITNFTDESRFGNIAIVMFIIGIAFYAVILPRL